jgi:putative two-component system response regulator
MEQRDGAAILLVDDDRLVIEMTSAILSGHGYAVTACSGAAEALARFREGGFRAVLADVMLPVVSGVELLEQIRSIDRDMPVMLMTAFAEIGLAVDAVKRGAFDFMLKPLDEEYVLKAVEKAVRHYDGARREGDYRRSLEHGIERRTRELAEALDMVRDMSKEIARRLTAVAEYRDTDTGAHIRRSGLYTGRLAGALGMPQDFIESIEFASSMHDIGKVAISDAILLKPGALTREEFEVMKTHSPLGERMLAGSPYPAVRMAASVAGSHHEKWDGTGYPRGLRGEAIPLEARIFMLVDQYDAIRSKRPYKPPISHEDAFRILTEGDGKTTPGHFDARVLRAFREIAQAFDEIFEANK